MMQAYIPVARGTVTYDEPMSKHTSWRVGGPADRFFQPRDLDDVAAFLQSVADGESIYWVGLGSNLLVRDGGLRGTVICTAHVANECNFFEPNTLQVSAGTACARAAKLAASRNCGGAEFLIGIPGTMGGALAMNAGAFGRETWQLVRSVETMNRYGVRRWRDKSEFTVGYRQVVLTAQPDTDEWFVGAELKLQPGQGESGRSELKRLLQMRSNTQPVGQPSCGSVFRNPEGDYAARLIEACGLKGLTIGGAQVSEKHANFILNTGSARALDIERLIEHVRSKVELVHGVRLLCEVRIIGERSHREARIAQ